MLPSAAFESRDCDASVAVTTTSGIERPATKKRSELPPTNLKASPPRMPHRPINPKTAPPKPRISSASILALSPTGQGMPQSNHCAAASALVHSPSSESSPFVPADGYLPVSDASLARPRERRRWLIVYFDVYLRVELTEYLQSSTYLQDKLSTCIFRTASTCAEGGPRTFCRLAKAEERYR